ncbi:hybrid sensor histidine kinase/response regulator [Ramlibacter sp. MAHUQ-53]|uniref:hybrid sensor histidine kinase/response regulator n=1 Tax=unclassified Ramlibacter TaxID=2617605 RepID=UPI00364547A9
MTLWRGVARYALALALTGLALAARFAMVGLLPQAGFPFLSFFPAVLITTFVAGIGPGLLASGLSILAAWYWFMGDPAGFGAMGHADLVALAFFSGVLLVDCVVIQVMNTALRRAHRAERQVRDTGDRVRLVLDKLSAHVALLDADGTLREVNEAPLAAYGLRREDLVGRRLWDLPWWTAGPQGGDAVREAVGRAARGEVVRRDIEVRRRDGAAMTADFQLAPLEDGEGPPRSLVACVVDVTARVQALVDLEHSRAEALSAAAAAERERRLLDATFNTVPAGIIVADAQGRLLRMNRANRRIWGIAPYSDTIDGYGEWKGWWAGDSPRAGQRIQAHEWGLARSVLHGEECHDIVEVEPFDRPGQRRVTMLASAPVLDPAGHIVGGVVVQVDITERIEAERALRETDRQKDTFLATLSHELRNPLAPIRAAAHVLRLSALPGERARNAVAVIERQGTQLTRLVDDLLDISRLNFGNLRLRREPADLREVVRSALEVGGACLEASGHALQVDLPEAPVEAEVDAARLAQCVSNLVNNACKFMPPPGRVDVTLATRGSDQGPEAVIRVRDTGQGIAPDMLPRVFELFAQEHRSGHSGNAGLGIGLALTRRLVELHGGRVDARSAGPGRGAEFEITLPMRAPAAPPPPPAAPALALAASDAAAAAAAPQAPPDPAPAPAPARAPEASTVLVVDDNTDAADTLQLLLEMQGLTVVTAGDGAGALAQARRHHPGVVVLDIGLPDMTGYEVARRLRAEAGEGERPVLIALTGWGQAADRARAAEAGFDHHLTKPADPDRLAAILRSHLQPA